MTVPLKAFSIKPYQRPSGTMTAWYYEIISKHFKVGQSQKCIWGSVKGLWWFLLVY